MSSLCQVVEVVVFNRSVSDLKWRVLAQLEREDTKLEFSEAVSTQEKHYHYEGETAFPDTKFCVAIAYARKNWRGAIIPSSRKRATRLIVRPHLRWEFPLYLVGGHTALPWLHEMFELHVRRQFRAYAGAMTLVNKDVRYVGLEVVMTAHDIRENPAAPVDIWDRAVSSYFAKSERRGEALSYGDLQSPLPTRDEAAFRWPTAAAFQRRPLRGGVYSWQGGAPSG